MSGRLDGGERRWGPALLMAAETIDRLTKLDFPRRGAIAALQDHARRLVGGPLGLYRPSGRFTLLYTPHTEREHLFKIVG